MRIVQLIHNPTSGDEAHSKEDLLAQLQSAGFDCRYRSTKEKDWKALDKEAEALVVAGGDGTVRKTVKLLMKEKAAHLPLGVLGLGTANNIAKSFGTFGDTAKTINGWKEPVVKKVDIGRVQNVPGVTFFLEGFGFGIFPYLMKKMKNSADDYPSTEAELRAALKKLHKILLDYEPRQCTLTVDGTDHSGKFFMVEVMNIRSIGPNMVLAPLADPGDGELEVVLVAEAQKEKFSDYLISRLTQEDAVYQFHTLRGKNIVIRWDGTRLHADDEMLKLPKQTEVRIDAEAGVLQFLLPRDAAKEAAMP